VFRSLPAPGHLRFRVHPLVSLLPLQSSFRCHPARVDHARLPWGSSPPSRCQHPESTQRQTSHRLPTFRPQRFSRSRRFAPPGALRVCFTPLPRSRFTPQGLPPTASRAGSSPGRALLPFPPCACIAAPAQRVRLQGLDPAAGPLPSAGCLSPPTPGPLSSFHSLRSCSGHLGDAFAPPPLMTSSASSSL
jgi:hypothetical protein